MSVAVCAHTYYKFVGGVDIRKDTVTGHEVFEEHVASCSREISVEATGGGHRLRWWYSKKFELEQNRSLMPLCCAVGLCCRSRYGIDWSVGQGVNMCCR